MEIDGGEQVDVELLMKVVRCRSDGGSGDVRWLAPARLIGKADRGLSIRIAHLWLEVLKLWQLFKIQYFIQLSY
jgi:hypothetical protein